MKKLLFIGLFHLVLFIPVGFATNPITLEIPNQSKADKYALSNQGEINTFFTKFRKIIKKKIKWLKESFFDEALQISFILLLISLLSVAGLIVLGTSSFSITFLVLLLIGAICFVGSLIGFMYHFFS